MQPRPVDVGDVFTSSSRVLRARFGAIFAANLALAILTNLISLPMGVLPEVLDLQRIDFDDTGVIVALLGMLAAVLAAWLLVVIANPIVHGMTYSLVAGELTGRPLTRGDAFRVGLRRGLPCFGTELVVGFLYIGSTLLCCFPLLLAIPFLSVAGPICVVGERGPIESVQRSYELTKDNFAQVVAIQAVLLVAVFVLSCVLSGIPVGVVSAATAALHGGAAGRILVLIVQTFFGVLGGAIIGSLWLTISAALYVRLEPSMADGESLARVFA